jgi:hypothetical protein
LKLKGSSKTAEPLSQRTIAIERFGKLTGAIHIYGGEFFNQARSEWDPEALTERPYDVEKNMRLFKEANERFTAYSAA